MRNIVNSFKHQRQESVTYAGADANNVFQVVTAVAQGTVITPGNVPVGAMVYSVDVSVNFVNSSASVNTTYEWFIVKFRDGQNAGGEFGTPNGASWSSIGLSDSRNQVIKSFMGVATPNDGGKVVNNFHIPIPKLMQRTRQGDVISLIWNSTQAGLLSIGARYKHYL